MSGSRPAWSRESSALQLPDFDGLGRFSPDWALDGATGAGVRVAVVDSGIDADHPWLEGCVDEAESQDFSVDGDGNVVVTAGPHADVFGHGTACAGIIHQLAPDASITSVRVLGPGLRGKAAAFHAGLQWAVDHEFDVINLSLGAGKRDWALAFHEICDQAYFSNSFIVTAANNVRRTSFPSLYASVTSVACNMTDDPLRFHVNPSPPTEFLARGIDVEVPWLHGETTVTTGNSFAAPHIAAMAALVRSKHPELRPFHVKAALWACAANVRGHDAEELPAVASFTTPSGRASGTIRALPVEPAASFDPTTNPPGESVDAAAIRQIDDALPDIAVGELLDVGAWGRVYTGQRVDGRAVAIRSVDRALAGDPVLTERFLSSVRAAASIEHPHVLAIDELIELDSAVLIVMPLCPTNLGDLDQELTLEDIGVAALSLLNGLDAAHRMGVLHGDVRAANALIDTQRRVVTSDVGLAAPLQANARTMVTFDRSQWSTRAPELALGGAVGAYTDVFAVGSLAYELLAGHAPYVVPNSFAELVTAATNPRQLARLPNTVPPTVATVIAHAVAHDPALRWATVADFATSLRHALDTELGDGWMWRSRFILDGSSSGTAISQR